MNERLRTAVLALAALAAFVALFQSNLRPPGRDGLSRPVSVDRQADGLAALATWLERDGRAVVSFRESYAELATQARAQAGNLLIIALPARERVPSAELPLLDAWLQQGNTLLVLAALADAPEWARERGATFDLSALTALDFRRERIAAPDTATDTASSAGAAAAARGVPQRGAPLLRPAVHTARATRPHPLLDGVTTLQARSEYARPRWTLQLPFDAAVLELARDVDDARGVLWERRAGAGHVVIVGYASLLSNRLLGEADNARLLANLVAQRVAADGVVLFDDGRHGLSPFYDPEQFYADPRLHATLLILFGVWLAWVFGATRLRPVAAAARPDAGQLLRGTADFLARVVTPREAAERMLDACAGRLAHVAAPAPAPAMATAATPRELPWRELEADPRVARTDLAALRQYVTRLRRGERVSLQELHNLMARIEEPLR
jgi:hypothetical protein